MPIKAVRTAKFAVLDAGGLKPAKAAPRKRAAGGRAGAAAAPPAGVTVIDDDAANVVLAKLNELNIAHRTYAHVAVPTVDEQRAALGALPGVLTKNLLLKDKKAGTFLVTVAADRHVDMKKLPTLLGIKANANLRLTDPSILGVEKGAVSPYAAINDAKGVVTVALDSELVNSTANINTHPLRSDRTVSASPQDVVAFLGGRATSTQNLRLWRHELCTTAAQSKGSHGKTVQKARKTTTKAPTTNKVEEQEGQQRNLGSHSGLKNGRLCRVVRRSNYEK